jgi:uncharacterized protein (TIGR02001 family)
MLRSSYSAAGFLALGLSVAPSSMVAAAEWGDIGGSIAGMTDYMFRGVSQTKNGPALQGAVEYTKDVGPLTPYAGLFLSNTRFPDTSSSGNLDVKYELDINLGVRGEIEKFKWDLGYIRYYYPFADMPPAASQSFDWSEGAVKLGYDAGFAVLNGAYFYSPNYSVAGGKGHYFNVGPDVPLPWYDITLAARIGRLNVQNNANLGLPDYTDWNIGINRDFPELLGLNFALTYFDTNIRKNASLTNTSDATAGTINDRVYDTTTPRIVLAVTTKF